MLVITRRVTEVFSIIIGNKIIAKVKINAVKGNQVWTAIEAKKSVKILRDEIIERDPELQKTLILDISDDQ